ncbi:A-kinase anchor protein 17A-like [Camelus ferus]|uniref:A-kinase anchor protein 17A-like n=1 Tax=Camelus ferus TaxID=419612 RepID=A0A8B8SUW5_CAMFR|nr:A-kinase anchor protein 17A-like [Camelus ferus]
MKVTISEALPQLKQPQKSISNWEATKRPKGMAHTHQFSIRQIAKSIMDSSAVEARWRTTVVKAFPACLQGKTSQLSDILKVCAAEFKIDFPACHAGDSFSCGGRM